MRDLTPSVVSPAVVDLYRLAGQLERDREQPVAALRERDRAIGQECSAETGEGLLLQWLDRVSPAAASGGRLVSESTAAALARILALVAGFGAMAGFLLGSERALVNVFLLLAVFVLAQFLLSVLSGVMMWRTVRGHVPMSLPMHPGRWIVSRSLPDQRYLREAQPVLRMLFLRYGQELGALFTLAAIVAFILLPALGEFSFVWGSTFNPGTPLVQRVMDTLAWPWAGVLPTATVPPEVLASSRIHPALINLDQANIESMRGWWPFLSLCLLVYALLPRLLLWALSNVFSRRLLARSFRQYPGAELVLARMQAPLVRTRGEADAHPAPTDPAAERPVPTATGTNERRLLLDYGNALGTASPQQFEELVMLDAAHIVAIGSASERDDTTRLQALPLKDLDRMLLLVKGWEPPMAELQDLLAVLATVPRCTVLLVPLPGRATPHRKVEDWRAFARSLPFTSVDVQLLNRVENG